MTDRLSPAPATAPALALDGLTPVPAGKIAAIVTFLEMRARPAPLPEPSGHGLEVRRVERPDPGWYRALFRRIGEDWLWFSRLRLSDAELSAILHDPAVEIHVLMRGPDEIGLLELDWRVPGEPELGFFGLVAGETGAGAGRILMNRAIEQVFARPLTRFFVHTCTLDHAAAVGFYMKAGFTAVGRAVEIADDPRLDGTIRRDAAPHIPVID
ncbi:GNAT family N-acetyltransferase [Ancylobacter defluvii]|uniref:N-acetyltransferase n=1 Tax=Ancylobacter defluvii TaxID=1282440 RepID=A0A9W6K301_9HYPH|nr:GNAT family N-acetyltransferase [Ancylobacter defluvii]MBS7588390.1 GNAT family N-acetyltransferase [Ancylobacter defluvii]GLK86795.1 N-acetyltransferase [Ancylobacter defluvii]